MAKRFDFRLAVGEANGPRSSIWHYWSRNEHVYVALGGLGGVKKFSFHPPDICRFAFTAEHGTPPSLSNRATHSWRRGPTPSSGTGNVVRVLRVSFWTDVLSTALDPSELKDHPIWIEAAPMGHSTVVDLMFTRDNEETLRTAIANDSPVINHKFIAYRRLPSGEAFCIASWHSSMPEGPLRVTASHEDLIASPIDPTASGRPVRLTTFSNPKDNDLMQAWEWGVYAIAPPLTDDQWETLRRASPCPA